MIAAALEHEQSRAFAIEELTDLLVKHVVQPVQHRLELCALVRGELELKRCSCVPSKEGLKKI